MTSDLSFTQKWLRYLDWRQRTGSTLPRGSLYDWRLFESGRDPPRLTAEQRYDAMAFPSRLNPGKSKK